MWLNFKGKLCSLSQPLVMGILNYTEDSFFDGGKYTSEKAIIERAAQLLEEGADLIDIGAMSTRPGAADIDEPTEIERIRQAVSLILQHFPDTIISIDTWRASVAQVALDHGAAMINDVSGGTFDQEMIPTVAKARVPYCLMHTPAKPDVMQQHTQYNNLIGDMLHFFGTQLAKLKELGANDIIIDPGFGFGKTLEQNYFLMQNLNAFATLNLPILVGISRKSMIYKLLETDAQHALNGTTVLNTIALLKGAHILRVHDVREAKECVKMVEALKRGEK
jgi:dihydropteroate synthase